MNMQEVQRRLPWGIHYGEAFKQSSVPHKDFEHALIHIMKAAGKLSAMVDDADHNRPNSFPIENVQKYLADLVICSMRMANTSPSGLIDLWNAVIDRIESKNEVKLT
jgi:hypothetical protein